MSDNRENRRQTRRISSILKNVVASDESPTQTFSRRSKRISFSHVNNVKEFVADVDNKTIWGDSYEKCHTVKNSSNSNSASQIPTINSVLTATSSNSVADAPPTIELFADIEGGSAEMDISHGHSESHTKHFHQTMVMEETVTTSTTNCKVVDMSMVVGNANKRKTIEAISTGTVTTDVAKSVKIRKMNDENLEPAMHNTILDHVNMSDYKPDRKSVTKSQVNLNTTRIFDGDADMSDVSLRHMKLPDQAVASSEMFDKTSVSIDVSSIASFVSDTSIPASGKTHIYSRGDISAGIDQTLAVRNPLQENNATLWNAADKFDDSEKHTAGDHAMDRSVPAFQSNSGFGRRTLEDLTISMDIQFKNHSLSPHSLNPDEPVIEDLTIFLDTNFQAEVSGENDDSAIQSMSKLSSSGSPVNSNTKNDSLRTEQLNTHNPSYHQSSTTFPEVEHKEYVFANRFAQRSRRLTTENLTDLSFDLTDNVACRDKTFVPTPDPLMLYDSANDRIPKAECQDYSTSHDQAPATDFSFAHMDPLSSTRFVPSNKFPLNFSSIGTNNKANCSSVTFNDCPTLTTRRSPDLRSGISLQNNTDELCNLEPDQLKKMSEAKKLFLSLSQNPSIEMLSDTKLDLVSISDNEYVNDESVESGTNDPSMNASSKNVAAGTSIAAAAKITDYKGARCLKCMSCRNSLDGGNGTFVGVGQVNERPKLDFSMYDQFKGLPTWKDVIEARKKREAAREVEKQLLVDQNVEAPDIRLLLMNKYSENTVESQPVYVPEPLICFPMRMNIKYLMWNKLRTEYPQWKYYDNFFHIGAIVLRYNEIPSIKIHIKFDEKAPMKAEELNMPLLFSRVFIEQCPTYLARISTPNLLKHNTAYGLLPTNLMSLLSSSDNIYRGLDEIEKRFQSVITKVNEFDALTVEHDALIRMDADGTCYIEKTFFDIQKQLAQQFTIEFDKLDMIGPDSVHFDPVCGTTDAFKALPSGLPFLRSFLWNPMSYTVPVSDV